MLNRSDLAPRQLNAIEFIERVPKCAIWADMGTGKTVTTLTAIADLLDAFVIGKVLIIAPLRVVLHTWPQEIAQWAQLKHLSYTVIRGTAAQRKAQRKERTDIHLINRELVQDFARDLRLWDYDCVVIDESSSFKSNTSQRFKALKKAMLKVNRLIELTGTPAANGYLNLWSQLYLIDAGQRLGRTMTAYKQRYFLSDYMGYKWELRKGANDVIEQAISDVVLRIEYPHASEPIYNRVSVELPAEAREEYKKLEKEFLLEFDDDTVVTAVTAAALTSKLQQVAGGAVYDTDGSTIVLHDAKLDALKEIVAGTGSPILVAYTFKHERDRILAAFPQAESIDAPKAIERWNKGEIPMLVAHPASAGHGLNLQSGGHVIVWYGLTWSLELYQQFNARLHRQGQQHQVIIHHIVATDTVDDLVLEALTQKDVDQRKLLDALKNKINS